MLRVVENRYSAQHQPRHAHAETTVTIIIAGWLRERVGAREVAAGPLSIVVKPRDTAHANDFDDGVRTLQIILDEDAAAELELDDNAFRAWCWHHGGPAVPAFLRLLRARHVAQSAGLDLDNAAYEALATLRPSPAAAGRPPTWLAVVREALDDSFESVSVKSLAAGANVHPVYLARQFRRWYGHSVTEHVRRRRVQHVAAGIAATNGSLSLAAHDAGFADHPHMCRAFSRETGMTPRAYRVLVGI